MQKDIDLSIVIVSSKKDYLFDCLKSLTSVLTGLNNEIILVDNASSDNIKKQVNEKFPNVIVIRRENNGGFGENNNMGMKVARGKYILLLNDDTKIFNKDIFKEMIEWMDKHPDVGISSCALVNPDQKTYQGSGGYFPTLPRVFAWMTFIDDIPLLDKIIKPFHPLHGWSPIHTNEDYFKKQHEQDWVTGAFFLMRKSAMDQSGLFDEDFFLYVEEVELCYRFKEKGWKVMYLPKWKTMHYGQVTTGSENAMVREMQHIVLFYEKHYPKWQKPFLQFTLKFGAVLRMIVFGFLKGPKVIRIYAKAFAAV